MPPRRRRRRQLLQLLVLPFLALLALPALAVNSQGSFSIVTGGDDNTASATYSVIGSGLRNRLTGGYQGAAIVGGYDNTAAGK
jgi:hypothetical protein